MSKESAVEILIFKPNPVIPFHMRGVHENLWIKKHFKLYVSIGVYLDGSELKYYFFENCDNNPQIFSSLVELKQELPSGLKDIFENTPKLFIMGHGHGGRYGLGNVHGPSEEIINENFDKIIVDFEKTLPEQRDEIFVTLEACNTDNFTLAVAEGQSKTFLEKLSTNHPKITFSGTGPWDLKDAETGYRASGGFPILNTPITAMGGGIWKHGNSVIYYHGNNQIAVRKSMFASTATAKELKINTIEYAIEFLNKNVFDTYTRGKIITKICLNRDILKIEHLKNASDLFQRKFENQKNIKLVTEQNRILEKEKYNYIMRVKRILTRAELGEKFTEKDLLIITLGLKDLSIFNGHEDLRDEIFANKALLQLVMVSCGKVLVAGPSNDDIIDLLLSNGMDINSTDENGMTALHYAVQSFYNYRKEPLNLIRKLLDCGASLKAEDNKRRTPLMLAILHSRKATVIAGGNLLELLEQRSVSSQIMRTLLSTNLCFFRKIEDAYLVEHRQDHPRLQQEYDKKFGVVLKSS